MYPLNDSSGASGGNGNNTDSGNSISTTEEETTETEENNNENPPPEETGENESGDITINVYYADDMAQHLVGGKNCFQRKTNMLMHFMN